MARTTTANRGRPRSPYRVISKHGRERGIDITPRDLDRLTLIQRWWTLSPAHIARHELHPSLWVDGPTPEYARAVRYITERLGDLSAIEPERGHGPLVDTVRVRDDSTGVRRYLSAYYVTNHGQQVADTPWAGRAEPINPTKIAHAWMAADIGMPYAGIGWRVLAEREHSSGAAFDHQRFPADHFASKYENRHGESKPKRPDIAILHQRNDQDYIAVEVERVRSRDLREYVEKLAAYDNDHHVRAVWYVCASHAIANRVEAARDKVAERSGFIVPLRVKVANRDYDGRYRLPQDQDVVSDLKSLAETAKKRHYEAQGH